MPTLRSVAGLMNALDRIQARVDVRMAEIEARVGLATRPNTAIFETEVAPSRFDVADVLRAFGQDGSSRGGCRKIGLCVGVKNVDPSAYGGCPQPCPGCDLDATDFASILDAAGVVTTLLVDSRATRRGVVQAMRTAANALKEGDLFVMSVAGHGARETLDGNGGTSVHESWCLWDGKLLDDEIVSVVREFAPGVRIVMVNDQCHSGGIFSECARDAFAGGVLRGLTDGGGIAPMLIQFAACRAEESSVGYPIGGTWMTALMKVLAVDRHISWREWFDRAREHPSLTERQRPQWFEVGPVSDDFRRGEVFK